MLPSRRSANRSRASLSEVNSKAFDWWIGGTAAFSPTPAWYPACTCVVAKERGVSDIRPLSRVEARARWSCVLLLRARAWTGWHDGVMPLLVTPAELAELAASTSSLRI